MRMKAMIKTRLTRWLRDEEGAMIADFAVMFPVFLMFMLSSVEMGMMTFRQTMLERGLDMTVRDLRLGFIEDPTHLKVKNQICTYAGFLPNCAESLRLEMQPVDPRDYTELPQSADCFVNGGGNELMVMRACIKIAPVFPTVGLGNQVAKDGNGDVALFSTTAFVNEP